MTFILMYLQNLYYLNGQLSRKQFSNHFTRFPQSRLNMTHEEAAGKHVIVLECSLAPNTATLRNQWPLKERIIKIQMCPPRKISGHVSPVVFASLCRLCNSTSDSLTVLFAHYIRDL